MTFNDVFKVTISQRQITWNLQHTAILTMADQ